MRKFQFRLEKLLELRRYEEREWELKLARITGECLNLENRIRGLDSRIRGGPDSGGGKGTLDYNLLLAGELFINRLKQEKRTLEDDLEKKNRQREEVSKEYLDHSRRRKVLEKLKEKQAREYYRDRRKEEFKVADDINNSAAIRKKINLKKDDSF